MPQQKYLISLVSTVFVLRWGKSSFNFFFQIVYCSWYSTNATTTNLFVWQVMVNFCGTRRIAFNAISTNKKWQLFLKFFNEIIWDNYSYLIYIQAFILLRAIVMIKASIRLIRLYNTIITVSTYITRKIESHHQFSRLSDTLKFL